jgi:hypothetical protein
VTGSSVHGSLFIALDVPHLRGCNICFKQAGGPMDQGAHLVSLYVISKVV